MEMSRKQCVYILFVSVAWLLFIFQVVLTPLASKGGTDWFPDSVSNVSGYYNTPITPASWAFSIWGLIYTWQALWLIYGLSVLCRRWLPDGTPLNLNPGHMPMSIYVFFSISCLTYAGWLLAWTHEQLEWSLVMVILTEISVFVSFVISSRALKNTGKELFDEGMWYEVWLVRVLVQNGLATYATWSMLATKINFDVVLQYKNLLEDQAAATVVLCLLNLFIICWFILDVCYLDAYLRYTVTPYFVLMWALSAVLDQHYDSDTGSYSFVVFLLVIVVIESALKLIVMVLRAVRKPLYNGGQYTEILATETPNYGSTMDGEEKEA